MGGLRGLSHEAAVEQPVGEEGWLLSTACFLVTWGLKRQPMTGRGHPPGFLVTGLWPQSRQSPRQPRTPSPGR